MNIIIDSLQLPNDMKFEINRYCYNNLGYTFIELQEIEKIKKERKWYNLRLKIELWEWKRLGTSISWLRPLNDGRYKGVYKDIKDEVQTIRRYMDIHS